MSGVSLKALNIAPMVSLVFVCLAIAWISVHGIDQLEVLESSLKLIGGVSVVVPLITLLANMVPADVKHMLVFCRIKNALPGHRFLTLIEKDSRLAAKDVVCRYPELIIPDMTEEEQNSFWYREIYRPNQEDLQVKSAHKSFLLYRDAGTSVLFLALIVLLLHLLKVEIVERTIPIAMFFILFLEAAALLFASYVSGRRMVTTSVCAGQKTSY